MMDIHTYFPTFLLQHIDIPLAQSMSPVVDRYLSMTTAEMYDIAGHKTTYQEGELNKALNSEPEIVEFIKVITDMGKSFLDYRGFNSDAIPFNPFVFVNQIDKGAFFHRHAHPNSVLSGVMYVEAYSESAGLIIHDPRPYKVFRELPLKNPNLMNATEINLRVKTGLIYMWDAWIEHEVPQNHSSLPRKTLVFNL
jgi:uncharacterized protein (TIGR02466 family)